jgi:hypothetical protein
MAVILRAGAPVAKGRWSPSLWVASTGTADCASGVLVIEYYHPAADAHSGRRAMAHGSAARSGVRSLETFDLTC